MTFVVDLRESRFQNKLANGIVEFCKDRQLALWPRAVIPAQGAAFGG
jgi:hypothetical protein